MPQVLIKSISCRHIQQMIDLCQDLGDQSFLFIFSRVKAPTYIRKPEEDAVVSSSCIIFDKSINDQFRSQTVHTDTSIFSFAAPAGEISERTFPLQDFDVYGANDRNRVIAPDS